MKTNIFGACIVIALFTFGCVHTVENRSTPGVPFTKDKFVGKYERTVDQVLAATRTAIAQDNGIVVREGTLYGTNAVRTLMAKVNQRTVWFRIEQVDPTPVTQVIVQARTAGGVRDLELAHEMEKEIAIALAAAR